MIFNNKTISTGDSNSLFLVLNVKKIWTHDAWSDFLYDGEVLQKKKKS